MPEHDPTLELENSPLTNALSYKVGYLLICCFFWLAPFFYTGLTRVSWKIFPRAWSYQHNAAALFTTEAKNWGDCHLEWQNQDGSWFEADERLLFPAGISGEGTRFDRIIRKFISLKNRQSVYLRITNHAWQRGRQLGILSPDTKAVRIVLSYRQVGDPNMTQPSMGWRTYKVAEMKPNERRTLDTFVVAEDRVRLARPARRPVNTPRPQPSTSIPLVPGLTVSPVPLLPNMPTQPPIRVLVPPSSENSTPGVQPTVQQPEKL
jgi:hypothetical protein